MKKLLLIASLALASFPALAQQKGKFSVGGGLSAATILGIQPGVGVQARYGLTERFRLSGIANYFKHEEGGTLDFGVEAHYLVPIKDSKFIFYPLAGIHYDKSTDSPIGLPLISLGAGASYQIAPKISLGAEAKVYTILPILNVNVSFDL